MEKTTQFFDTNFTTDGLQNQTEAPGGGPDSCFIDPQLAFIIASSSGSVMLVLLISVVVLAYKVITLKQQCKGRRSGRRNVDVRGSGQWSTERPEEGIVGPCETNLLLEEVQAESNYEAPHEEVDDMLHQSNTKRNKDEENVLATMQSSTSRDSCTDPAKELENMPLVV